MQKLNPIQKQKIHGGLALGILGGSALKLLHGILTTSWVSLEIMNMVADNLPKHQPNPKKPYVPVTFNNHLINSKVTIFS